MNFLESIFLLLFFGLCASTCSDESVAQFSEGEIASSDRLIRACNDNIDSLFVAFKSADSRVATRIANYFFARLDDEGVTDTLIIFQPDAEAGVVGATTYYWMGEWLYGNPANTVSGIELCDAAIPLVSAIGDKAMLGNVYSLKSAFYHRMGQVHKALECTEACYNLNIESGNREMLSSDLNNLAVLSLAMKDAPRARGYIDRSIEIEETLEREHLLAIRYGTASEVYFKLDLPEKAEDFARRALRLDSLGGRAGKTAIRRSQLSSILMERGLLEQAKSQLEQAIPVLDSVGNFYSEAICLNQLADINLRKGMTALASQCYSRAYGLSLRTKNVRGRHRAAQGLWKSLKGSDMAQAALWLERSALIADSLHRTDIDREFDAMQSRFEAQEMQLRNEELKIRHKYHHTIWVSVVSLLLVGISSLVFVLLLKRKTALERKRIERMRDKFYAHVAKDFQTPLQIIHNLALQLLQTSRTESVGRTMLDQSQLLLNLVGDFHANEAADKQSGEAERKPKEREDGNNQFVSNLIDAIYSGMRAGDVSVEGIASKMLLSRSQLNRRIREITGQTASDYIMCIRLEKAKNILKSNPELPIGDVALRCGFDDLANFSRVFKQRFDVSPTNFRKKPTE